MKAQGFCCNRHCLDLEMGAMHIKLPGQLDMKLELGLDVDGLADLMQQLSTWAAH